jgi:hypothetical protein
MKRRAILFATTVIAAHVQAGDLQKSLCQTKENVIFSCSTGKKLISVCSSKNLSPTAGYVQYRFGTKEKPELTFPEPQTHPISFSTGGTLMYSGGGGAYMRFNKGTYSYVVYSGIGKGWDKQGVVIEKNGKLLSNIICKDVSIENIGAEFFEKNAIPEDKIGFEIP